MQTWTNGSVPSFRRRLEGYIDVGALVGCATGTMVFNRYIKCSDEHGVINDPHNVLRLNEKLKLVPSHCDPTVNVYDWYVAVRNGRVEALWPVTARGMTL